MESEVYSASFEASQSDGLTADASTIVVAHELKAPLSLMRQLALSLDYEDDIVGAREVGRQIVATSDRALRQVQDLTRIARLDDALFEMEPVNPRIVCDEVVAELWKLFRFNKRELQLDYRNKRHLAVANRQLL